MTDARRSHHGGRALQVLEQVTRLGNMGERVIGFAEKYIVGVPPVSGHPEVDQGWSKRSRLGVEWDPER